MGQSCGYPTDPPPRPPEWEWYKPSKTEMKRLKRDEPDTYQHCAMGGLLIRRITA
jgi:hypothetical protein